nr:PmoA family protein [Microtetraspora sp. NBRC 13810]
MPWSAPGPALRVAGRTVARYAFRPDLPVTLSPRPYLHPVRTLGGTTVTETRPADHVHHLGVSVAIADVAGRNFWGGRTWVPGRGPAWLDDHGVQRHVRFHRRADDGFTEHLSWTAPDGAEVVREERTVTARPVTGGWALDVTFALTGADDAPFEINSSGSKGRTGAGYGGFFWRAPGSSTGRRVYTRDAEGEAAVHGSRAPWLALSGTGAAPGRPDWTLVFVQPGTGTGGPEPWFARIGEYPGIGVSLAWDRPLTVEHTLVRRVVTVVADGRIDREEAAALALEAGASRT